MGEVTKIEWCDHTFNPWIGCTKVSPGCQFCYAEALMATRWGKVEWGPNGERKVTSDANWKEPLKWSRKAAEEGVRKRVFCSSLADVFEDRPELSYWRMNLLELIAETPNLDWMLLTKRPENIRASLHDGFFENVWLYTSVENQEYADKRIPQLMESRGLVPVLGLSVEPLLGPIEFKDLSGIDHVIVGGESGPNARPCEIRWIRWIVDQCRAADVSVFIKQLGANPRLTGFEIVGPSGNVHYRRPFGHSMIEEALEAPGYTVREYQEEAATAIKDRKGGVPFEWPEDLRVREVPDVWEV